MRRAPALALGPVLRYVNETDATIWGRDRRAVHCREPRHEQRAFHVRGHRYVLVHVGGLEPGSVSEYEIRLHGERR